MVIRDGKAQVVLAAKADDLAETSVERKVIVALQANRGGNVIECATRDCLTEVA